MAQSMTKQRPSGWWYPYIFVGGFAVVLAVNLTLLFFATSTFNGLESRTAYQEGLSYNQAIALEEEQIALGWTVVPTIRPMTGQDGLSASTPRQATIEIAFKDRNGQPLDGLSIEAVIRRPTVEGYDQTVALLPIGPGLYGVQAEVPMAGQWDLRLLAIRGEDAYRLRERFILR